MRLSPYFGLWNAVVLLRISVILINMIVSSDCKECSAGDLGSISGLGRSPRGGHGNALQYSRLENSIDRGARWAIVHGGCKELDTIMTNTFTSHLGGSDCKESACKAGDLCLIPGSGRSSGEGSSNLLHHSFLENSMDRGAWWAGPRSHKKSDMMEQLTFTKTFIYYAFFSSCIYLIDTLYNV